MGCCVKGRGVATTGDEVDVMRSVPKTQDGLAPLFPGCRRLLVDGLDALTVHVVEHPQVGHVLTVG